MALIWCDKSVNGIQLSGFNTGNTQEVDKNLVAKN